MIVAICPDDYTDPKIGKCDASSPRWAELLQGAGHKIKWVDVRKPDILEQIKGCDGFMWRHIHSFQDRQIARRLLPVIENELGLEVYPNQATCWHYDDKISQYYLLSAAGVPIPKTFVCFDYEQAMEWVRTANFPLVLKLWTGASSENVVLVRSLSEAEVWIKRLFGDGLEHMKRPYIFQRGKFYWRLYYSARILLKGNYPPVPWELHKNYVLFQEFLPDNQFDTRITVIGNRAFGLRRFNRPNDFRASGSGRLDADQTKIDLESVRLAFWAARGLGTQSLAFDILRRGKELVISEISYTYVSWAVHNCPGHWELEEDELAWKAGQMWPEEAQIQDFVKRFVKRKRERVKQYI